MPKAKTPTDPNTGYAIARAVPVKGREGLTYRRFIAPDNDPKKNFESYKEANDFLQSEFDYETRFALSLSVVNVKTLERAAWRDAQLGVVAEEGDALAAVIEAYKKPTTYIKVGRASKAKAA